MQTTIVRFASVVVLVSASVFGGGACNDSTARGVGAPLPDAPRPSDATTADGENCFDGIDNNGNGLVDCADPSCAGVAMCAPAVPNGWLGHAELYDGASMPQLGCITPWTSELVPGRSDPTAAPATCGACACGAPNGSGACAASGGGATIAPVAFASVGLACEGAPTSPATVSCAGTTCVAAPAPAFTGGLCVHQAGDAACPAPYTARHVYFAAVSDNRGCAPCACGAGANGACAASGGAPTGGVVGVAPTTFCCLPAQ
jgi:hypothetical protein